MYYINEMFMIDYLWGMALNIGLDVSFDNMQNTGKGHRERRGS
jgi:hypothetical protein